MMRWVKNRALLRAARAILAARRTWGRGTSIELLHLWPLTVRIETDVDAFGGRGEQLVELRWWWPKRWMHRALHAACEAQAIEHPMGYTD